MKESIRTLVIRMPLARPITAPASRVRMIAGTTPTPLSTSSQPTKIAVATKSDLVTNEALGEHLLAIDRLGRETGATYYMVRLALFAAALALETGRGDIVLGAYVTTRRRPETQAMFGFFSNLTTFRMNFAGAPTFRECLARVRAVRRR